MNYQQIFKRYEIKYLLSMQEKEFILDIMKPYMKLDKYGHSTIRNVYFDTDTFRSEEHTSELQSDVCSSNLLSAIMLS